MKAAIKEIFVQHWCKSCDRSFGTLVNIFKYNQYMKGDKSVSDVFPDEPAPFREILIQDYRRRNGGIYYPMCADCWNELEEEE